MEVYEGTACPPGDGKIAIIVSKFNKSITENLLKGALAKLKEYSVPDTSITVVWVPGAFELPQLAQRFALDINYQAIICLGCVIKGETSHDEHINRAVSLEIARISAEYAVPVAFGLLTCNTLEQAIARSGLTEQSHDKAVDSTVGNKGCEAAEAALEMLRLYEILPPIEEEDEVGAGRGPIDISGAEEVYPTGSDGFVSDFDVDEEDDEEDDNDSGWFLHGEKSARPERNEKNTRGGRYGSDSSKHSKEGYGHSKSGGHKDSGYKKESRDGKGSNGGKSGMKKGSKFGGKKPKK